MFGRMPGRAASGDPVVHQNMQGKMKAWLQGPVMTLSSSAMEKDVSTALKMLATVRKQFAAFELVECLSTCDALCREIEEVQELIPLVQVGAAQSTSRARSSLMTNGIAGPDSSCCH